MSDTTIAQGALRRRKPQGTAGRRRTSVIGVVGEVLITLGVIALLYVLWQMWLGDYLIGNQMKSESQSLSQEWAAADPTQSPEPSEEPTPNSTPDVVDPVTVAAPLIAEPSDGEAFAIMRIPRFGEGYYFNVVGGVSVSGSLDQGIGHYPGTSMPGQVGNFAVAGHRGSHGAPFQDLPSLRVGDAIVIETPDGWYTYRYRSLEYVTPSEVDVLLPVPQQVGVAATGTIITMTTCSPRYGSNERAIAYGVFEGFTPRTAGPPAALTEGVPA